MNVNATDSKSPLQQAHGDVQGIEKKMPDKKVKNGRKKLDLQPYVHKVGVYYTVLKKVPFVLFGERIKSSRQKYETLQKQLNQARIPLPLEIYISNAIFFSILAGVFGAFLGLSITYAIIKIIGLPEKITNLTFSSNMAFLLSFKEVFITLFITLFFIVGLSGLVYSLFMIYPGYRAGERRSKIDVQLPYAVTFMYALSKGGMNIIDVFRALSRSEDTYGEAAKEIDVIVRDMDYFGHDLRTALSHASQTTPSERFKDLIYNLLTVIDSGGNIPNYFRDKSEQYLIKSEVDQKGFLDTLALLAESYVTAFVAGPLFIIIMGVMMAVMGSGSSVMVYAIIYGVLPVGSLMFVIMISIITPTEMGEPKLLNTRLVLDHGIPQIPVHLEPVYDERGEAVEEAPEKTRERNYYLAFIRSKKLLSLKRTLKAPLGPMFKNPLNTLFVTVPLSLLLLVVPLVANIKQLGTPELLVDFIDDYVVFAILLIIVPLSVFFEIKNMKKKKLENNFPDFLKKLASTNETGMTLRDSIKLMARSETDALSREVKMIWHDVLWGIEVNDSLIRFANRLRTQVVTRSLSLITKANESSGDVGEVLIVAARDAASEQGMRRERTMNMLIYIVIIYISFFVFVGVIFVISTTFLSEMAAAGEQMAASGGQGGFLSSFNLKAYTQLFKHASIIQGLSSGLMAGAMGEGRVMAGLKHSTIMMTIGYVVFTLFI